MRWTLKAAIYGMLSAAPCGSSLRTVGQTLFGALRSFPVTNKLQHAETLMSICESEGFSIRGKRTLEVGTGWVPLLPIFFYLLGHESCHTYDLTRLIRKRLTLKATEGLCTELRNRPNFSGDLARHSALDRVARQGDVNAVLDLCRITYHAPADARNTLLPPRSIDVAYTNNVLEHIPRDVIRDIFLEIHRVLAPEGVMVHSIDLSDHYSHQDRSISSINFLRFTEDEFQKYNNPLYYQNRLRPVHYRKLLEDAGFKTVSWSANINNRAADEYRPASLASPYASLPLEEVCSDMILVAARPR